MQTNSNTWTTYLHIPTQRVFYFNTRKMTIKVNGENCKNVPSSPLASRVEKEDETKFHER